MKKIISFILALLLAFTVVGCGNKDTTPKNENNSVQVDENLLDVTITLKNSFFELFDTTAESYVKEIQNEETPFKNVVINEDKSVSITMKKGDYKKLMKELDGSVKESLQELIDDETFTIDNIEYNNDYSKFTIKLSGNEVTFFDSFSVLSLSMLGGFYQLFSGNEEVNVDVTFVGANGSILDTWNSSQLSQ